MINLTLSNYQKTDEIYSVKLGNGTLHEFRNLKKCNKFLRKTSKFFTCRYNELNLLFADVFQQYRQIYFYFDNNRNTRKAEIYEARRRINRLITHSETIFEQLTFISDYRDGNIKIFLNLYSLCDSLIEISIAIKKINQNKSYAATQVRCDYLIEQLKNEKQLIQNYGLEKASRYESIEQNLQLFNSSQHVKIVS